MKILVLSDSHNHFLEVNFSSYDFVIHCGDYGPSKKELIQNQVFFVRGNCDSFGPEILLKTLFSRKIMITHGSNENVKYTMNHLYFKALENHCSVCIFGHTHQQVCFEQEGILFINPGSYPDSYIEILDEKIILHQDSKIKIIHYRW